MRYQTVILTIRHPYKILSVRFSPNGDLIVSGSGDHLVNHGSLTWAFNFKH
jgi:WD40 repeat protein